MSPSADQRERARRASHTPLLPRHVSRTRGMGAKRRTVGDRQWTCRFHHWILSFGEASCCCCLYRKKSDRCCLVFSYLLGSVLSIRNDVAITHVDAPATPYYQAFLPNDFYPIFTTSTLHPRFFILSYAYQLQASPPLLSPLSSYPLFPTTHPNHH